MYISIGCKERTIHIFVYAVMLVQITIHQISYTIFKSNPKHNAYTYICGNFLK